MTQLPAHAVKGWHHAALSVPDLDRAIDWYGRILGFTVEKRWEIPAVRAQVAYLTKGDMRLEVFEVENAAQLPSARSNPREDLQTHGHKHFAFSVVDYDAVKAAVIANEIEIQLEVGQIFGRAFFIQDCFGNPVEFVEVSGDMEAPKGA